MPQLKVLRATTKNQCSQINNFLKKRERELITKSVTVTLSMAITRDLYLNLGAFLYFSNL